MSKSTKYVLVGALVVLLAAIVCCVLWYNTDKLVLQTSEPALQTALITERIAKGDSKENIAYCDNQKLDFYAPTETVSNDSPLIMYVHGGGWHTNNKDSDTNMRGLFEGLRAKGYAIASIDYSLTPENQYPKPQQDVLCAVRFMRANANRFSVDANKFAIAGFSAGANLAALAGTNSNVTTFNNGLYKLTKSDVQAVVGISGVYDFTNNLRPNSLGNIRNLMQDTKFSEGSPSSYVSAKSAPMLLIHGAKDSTVYPIQSTNYAGLLEKNSVNNTLIIVANAEHDLSASGEDIAPSKNDIITQIQVFLKNELGF